MNKKIMLLCVLCSTSSFLFPSSSDGSSSESSEYAGGVKKMTQLMYAAQKGDFNQVKDLVEKGAILDEKDEDNFTAFTHALIEDRTEIVDFLHKKMNKPFKK